MAAYVVPEEPGIGFDEIRDELAENLVSFMILEFFVEMDAIPLNANGKPDVKKLPVVKRTH